MNSNRNGFLKAINQLELNGVQLISGKHENCVISLLYGGYKFEKLANFNGTDAFELLDSIKYFGVAETYKMHTEGTSSVKSVCVQKVNKAHGRTREEIIRNAEAQSGTYCDRFENVQFYKRTLIDVLKMALRLDCDYEFASVYSDSVETYENFVKTYNDMRSKGSKQDIYNYIKNNCIVVDNKVFSIKNIIPVIDQWIFENKLGDFTEEQKIKAIKEFEKMYNLQAV